MSLSTGLARLGTMQGKTERDFQAALGNPVSISNMARGMRLLQWRSGRWNRQHLAVLFDANHRFVKVTHGYHVGGTMQEQSVPIGSHSPTRACPWCAETIKAAARLCRFCGRDVEPIDSQTVDNEDLDLVRREYPSIFDRALPCLDGLPAPPDRPAAWLRELCSRIDSGSPPGAAAALIPRNWAGPAQAMSTPTRTRRGDPTDAGDYPDIALEHSAAYEEARAVMAGLDEQPTDPAAWLRELCTRIEAGGPSGPAAARIPLDFSR